MILTPTTVTGIQQGKVTCVIVPASDGRGYHVGESYPVQWWKPREGGGAPVVSPEKLRVKVTRLEQLTLSYELDPDLIASAGYESPATLWEHWRVTHRSGPLADPPITVVHFEIDRSDSDRYLRPGGGYTSSPRMALGARTHHGSDLRAVTHSPKDVAERPPRGREPEPAAVSVEWERRFAQDAKQRFSRVKAKEEARLEAKSRAARLKEAQRRAETRGADVSDLTEKIDAAIEEMGRRESNGDEEAA